MGRNATGEKGGMIRGATRLWMAGYLYHSDTKRYSVSWVLTLVP